MTKCYVWNCFEKATILEKVYFPKSISKPKGEIYTFYCCEKHRTPQDMIDSAREAKYEVSII